MEDLKEFILDQYETLTEENISEQKLAEIARFIVAYAEDNHYL